MTGSYLLIFILTVEIKESVQGMIKVAIVQNSCCTATLMIAKNNITNNDKSRRDGHGT